MNLHTVGASWSPYMLLKVLQSPQLKGAFVHGYIHTHALFCLFSTDMGYSWKPYIGGFLNPSTWVELHKDHWSFEGLQTYICTIWFYSYRYGVLHKAPRASWNPTLASNCIKIFWPYWKKKKLVFVNPQYLGTWGLFLNKICFAKNSMKCPGLRRIAFAHPPSLRVGVVG